MPKGLKIPLISAFLACLVFYGVMVSFHVKNPIMFDEVHSSKAAQMISITGRPAIYYWCQDYRPWIVMVCHSTLQINLLALAYRLFGIRELTGYLFGVANALLSLVLMVFIIRLLIRENKKRFAIGIIASCLYLINPLLIRGSLIIDIDNTILMSCILLFTLLSIRSFLYPRKRDVLWLSLAFTLCLWAKETCLLFLVLSIFIYLLVSEQRKQIKMWIKWASIVLWGFILFLTTWWLYSKAVNLPFTYVYEYTVLGRIRGFLFASLYSRLATVRNDIFWLSPFFVLLAALAIFGRVRNFIKERKTEAVDFIVILGVSILAFYTVIIPTTVNPKYIVFLVPIFSILISLFLYNDILPNLNKKFLFLSMVISPLLFVYYSRLFPDPLLILLNKQNPSGYFWAGILNNKILLPLTYIIPLFLLYVIFKKNIRSGFVTTLAVSALILLVPSSISLSITQGLGNYATFYHYGERGLKETINYVKHNIDKNEVIFGRKEFEYYLPHRVYFDETGNTTILKELADNKKISYIVFSDYYEGEKKIASHLERDFEKVYSCGNFSVYKIATNKK